MSLKEKTISGFMWNAIAIFGRGGLCILVTIILSRLIAPEDFGIIALLLVFNSLSAVFIDSGFSQAVIRDNELTDIKLSSVFLVNLAIAVLIYITLFFSFPWLSNFVNLSEHTLMGRIVFLAIIFEALSLIQTTVLSKNMNFKLLAWVQLVATICSSIIAIIMAFLNCGCWSLAMNILLYSVIKAILLWYKGDWHGRLKFKLDAIRGYFNFSIHLLLTGFFDQVMTNSESIFIGHYYSKSDLAFFARAREIDSWTSQTLTKVIIKATYPALVQMRESQEGFRRAYLDIMGCTMFVTTFMMIFIMSTSSSFVTFFWGSAWHETATYLIPWCLYGIMYPFQAICINIFQAYGKTRNFMYISMSRQVVRIVAIIIFIKISIYSLTWAITSVAILGILFTIYFASKLIGCSPFLMVWNSRFTFLNGAISGSLLFWINKYINNLASFYQLIIAGVIFSISYCILGVLFKDKYFYEAKKLALKLLNRNQKKDVPVLSKNSSGS